MTLRSGWDTGGRVRGEYERAVGRVEHHEFALGFEGGDVSAGAFDLLAERDGSGSVFPSGEAEGYEFGVGDGPVPGSAW